MHRTINPFDTFQLANTDTNATNSYDTSFPYLFSENRTNI